MFEAKSFCLLRMLPKRFHLLAKRNSAFESRRRRKEVKGKVTYISIARPNNSRLDVDLAVAERKVHPWDCADARRTDELSKVKMTFVIGKERKCFTERLYCAGSSSIVKGEKLFDQLNSLLWDARDTNSVFVLVAKELVKVLFVSWRQFLDVLMHIWKTNESTDKCKWGRTCWLSSQISGRVCGSGVPTTSKILLNWSIRSVPGKRGRRRINSAMMQPTDQMSTFSS